MASLKQKQVVLNSLSVSISAGALALLFYMCNHGFTDLVNISAKNLSALYTTSEIRSSLWREMSNLQAHSRNKAPYEVFHKSAQHVSKMAKVVEAHASNDLRALITDFIRIHDALLSEVETARFKNGTSNALRVEDFEKLDELYRQGSEKLNEFSESVLVGSQEQQGESIRHTTFSMQIALAGAIALTFAVLLLSFLYLKKSIINPLLKISAASLDAANGNLKPICGIASTDEIEVLATNFNHMIQEVRVSADAIRAERDLAEKANHAKSAFLANMSHELRTPMHGILSFARFGQQKIETATKERLKSYFDEIHESGFRLMTLLNDILDLSKLEAGRIEYSLQADNLTETVQAVVSEMKAFAEEKGLRVKMTASKLVYASFDSLRMMQVVRNLLSNAIKFSERNSVIQIRLEKTSSGAVSCRFTNQGVGIPAEELESVFDKFIQSSKTKSGAGGTGLGLAICREIIQQHNGKIWAESALSGETHFTFELPEASAEPLRKAA